MNRGVVSFPTALKKKGVKVPERSPLFLGGCVADPSFPEGKTPLSLRGGFSGE